MLPMAKSNLSPSQSRKPLNINKRAMKRLQSKRRKKLSRLQEKDPRHQLTRILQPQPQERAQSISLMLKKQSKLKSQAQRRNKRNQRKQSLLRNQ
jgi:hypothetical protein